MTAVAASAPETVELEHGWELAETEPGQCVDATGLAALSWIPARVPGTAAAALRDAGRWRPGERCDVDGRDWWFRTRFEARPAGPGEQLVLVIGGLATIAEVHLNGELVLESESMFAAHEIDVGSRLAPVNELVIGCRALTPRLRIARRPRARWRTKLVSEPNLRFFRTMLLGRAPGFAPGPAVAGPWRPIRLERRRGLVVERLRLRATVTGSTGVLTVHGRLRSLPAGPTPTPAELEVEVELSGPTGVHRGSLDGSASGDEIAVEGELAVPGVALWWPHTHGDPALYRVRLLAGGRAIEAGRVGFRTLVVPADLERDGLQLRINGVPVFARGAVWTPLDLTDPHSSPERLRAALELVAGAGMNMLRVAGIAAYESRAFHDLCDELGILLWQDFMFANLDYPESDPAFMETVALEACALLDELGGRPSLAVLCGGSEVAQQVAMLGLDPELANGPLYGELLPSLVSEAEVQAPYIPSTPWGGDLPFRPDRGVANYYGVGAYLRPLEDARRSGVRFAGECLAFSNVPDDEALEAIHAPGGLVTQHPAWKAGIPRDAGAGWDFEDVRDHYTRVLYDVDPVSLRSVDHDRYLELSRISTGEVMAEVFGEWRRRDSPCGGGLVLWLTDLQPGAGWGLLDHRGEPKLALGMLRRALAPVAVWSTDEGLGGIDVHVANDGPRALPATLRVALYRDFEVRVAETERRLVVDAHGECAHNVEQLLGWFADVSWAYRFGPPAQNLIVFSLQRQRGPRTELLSQSVRLPVGRPPVETPERLGLEAAVVVDGEDSARLTLGARRFVHGVRVHMPGYAAEDDGFALEPGHERELRLTRVRAGAPPTGSITAINMSGRARIGSRTDTE